MNDAALFAAVRERVRSLLKDGEGCHDFDHTLRVLENARKLAVEEHCSPQELRVIELAALLHDCARPEEFASGGKVCHAELGAVKAAGILRELGCTDEGMIQTIAHAVERHRYRGRKCPETLTERILYDADKLDSIGAVGIGRAFHYAGRIGARLHNTEQEAEGSPAYSREDTAYREYLVKLRHVPERMTTESGKRLAEERAAFMHEFFRRMNLGL